MTLAPCAHHRCGLLSVAAAVVAVLVVTSPLAVPRLRCASAAPRRASQTRLRQPGRKIKARLFYVVRRRRAARRRGARRRRTARARAEQAREIVDAQIAPVAEPLVSAIPAGHDAARAVRHGRAARRTSISAASVCSGAYRRHRQRAADGVHDRQRAHREPAGGHVGAAADRRQGGGHAGRPRRSAPAAREKSRVGAIDC